MKKLLAFLASGLIATVSSTVLSSAVVRADERPEATIQVEKLIQEARKLKEANQHDEAQALMKKAQAISRELQAAREREIDERARAQARETRERAAQEREAHERETQPSRERDNAAKEARVRQLLEASELLQVVGKPDLAEQLRREAQALSSGRETPPRERGREGDRPREGERTREGDRPRGEAVRAREAGPREGDPREQIQDLQANMRRMHAEMEELRQMVRRLAERLGDR